MKLLQIAARASNGFQICPAAAAPARLMTALLASLVVLAHVASCQFSHPLAVSKGDLRDIEERRKNDGLDELGGTKLIADGFDGRRANLFQVSRQSAARRRTHPERSV